MEHSLEVGVGKVGGRNWKLRGRGGAGGTPLPKAQLLKRESARTTAVAKGTEGKDRIRRRNGRAPGWLRG